MSKINPIIQFLTLVVCSLGVAFFLHITILENRGIPKYDNLIVLSYGVNCLLAASIFVPIYIFRRKLKHQIGFLFMGGSFLKFLFFFLLFYSPYKSDGEMDRLEFAAFFVPYAISLIVETVFIAKILKKWMH